MASRPRDLAQQPGQLPGFLRRQPGAQGFFDGRAIDRPYALAQGPAGAGDADDPAAAVVGAGLDHNQPPGLEPGEQPRHVVLGEQQARGQFERPQGGRRRPLQLQQCVVPRQGRQARRLEFSLDGRETDA